MTAPRESHHHAVCDRCGLVRDLPRAADPAGAPPPAGLGASAPTLSGFEVRAVEHIYRGLCAACAAAAPARDERRSP
jgi:Fe2+ or Zn2+ uptake regulation protein